MNIEGGKRTMKMEMKNLKKFILLLLVLSLLSCSEEKTAPVGSTQGEESGGGSSLSAQEAPTVAAGAPSIEIVPHEADRSSRLTLALKGFEMGGAKIEWLVNGDTSDSTGAALDAGSLRKGDRIQARVSINGGVMLSNEVVIGDTPPEFSRLKIMPEVFKPGDRLSVEAEGKDIDGDPVTISYEWTKNGEPAGTENMIASSVQRGDKIAVTVTPYDGEKYGRPVVLEREVANMPPMITSDGRYNFSGGVFSCTMHGTDPDGDTLVWSLTGAPSGMRIDPSSGVVTWRVPAGFAGRTSFTACASDGHGGQSTQTFNFEVK